jgi:hypothetical protein
MEHSLEWPDSDDEAGIDDDELLPLAGIFLLCWRLRIGAHALASKMGWSQSKSERVWRLHQRCSGYF